MASSMWAWIFLALGCRIEAGPARIYDCDAGFSNWLQGWSDSKKDWCCKNHQRGFVKYHCHSGGEMHTWSADKRSWCCGNFQVGCPRTTLSPLKCDADCNINGESSTCQQRIRWNQKDVFGSKDNACALAYSKVQVECDVCRACTIETACQGYDCQRGYSNWYFGWSARKKSWCCANQQRACPGTWHGSFHLHVETYDCDAAFVFWLIAWSDQKKDWCCKHQQRGCVKYHCGSGDLQAWPTDKLLWCMRGTLTWTPQRVQVLLHKGANVSTKDRLGNTPLHAAAQSSATEDVKLLLDNGASVSSRNDEGNTALHLTTSREIAEILLKHGAKIDARNNRGQTALYLCSRKGFSQVAELLLKKGAAVDAQDDFFGKTPLAEAAINSHLKTERTLLRHNADAFHITYDGRMISSMAKPGDGQDLLKNYATFAQLGQKIQVWLWLPMAIVAGFGYSALHHCCTASSSYSLLRDGAGDDADFFHGARLIVAKSKSHFAGFRLLAHMVGVSSKLVLVFAGGMWIVHWPIWMALHACLYGIPAVMHLGIAKTLKSPALVLTVHTPALELAILFMLLCIILVLARPGDCDQAWYNSIIAESVCKATPWVPVFLEESMMALQNPEWKALLRKPYYVWEEIDYRFSFDDKAENKKLVQVHAVDVVIVFLLGLFAACLVHVVILVFTSILGSFSEGKSNNTDDFDGEVRELLEKSKDNAERVPMLPGVEIASKWITLESSWNCDSLTGFMSSTNVKVGLLLMDIVLDINTLKAMLQSGHFLFAASMMFILSKSFSQQILAGNMWRLWDARAKTISRGIQHRILLEILVEEQSFEAFASLALTTYSYWYTVADALTAVSQSFSIVSSVYSLGAFLYQSVDLGIELEDKPSTKVVVRRATTSTVTASAAEMKCGGCSTGSCTIG